MKMTEQRTSELKASSADLKENVRECICGVGLAKNTSTEITNC